MMMMTAIANRTSIGNLRKTIEDGDVAKQLKYFDKILVCFLARICFGSTVCFYFR